MGSFLKKFGKVNVVGLLFIALLFPAILGYEKIAFFLGFLFSSSLLLILSARKKSVFNTQVFIWLCFVLGLNLFFVIWGALNGANNDAAVESLLVYVLYPSFYIFFIAAFPHVLTIKTLTTILLVISITSSYIVISHIFRIEGIILPGYELLYFLYPELSGAINTFAFTGVDGYLPRVLERLIFLAPFSIALVAVRDSIRLSRFIVWTNFVLIIVAIFVSERRAMVVILLLAVMAIFVRWIILHPKRIVAVGLIGVGVVIFTIVLFWWNAAGISVQNIGIEQGLGRIIKNYAEGTLTIRREQFEVLMTAAAESPLIGAGFGNTIPGYVRDVEHPWRFELTYVALFFQTGLLGLILYAVTFILLVVIVINSLKKSGGIILPYIFGLLGGLIAVATNPYMNYGTGQWILFIPLAVFNCALLAKSSKGTVEYMLPNRDARATR